MRKKIDPWTGLMGDDAWGRQSGTGWDVLAIPMELIQLYVVYSAAAAGINLGDGC
ncbi:MULTISPECIES: hypothetical protein [Streptomyces]|uniref:hypothetical protein n=1 Tax=Streptomyces TaxID=1883 RepID=UPI000AF84DDD|nr:MULTISPECIES: hypothetical protein [Streptomyces]